MTRGDASDSPMLGPYRLLNRLGEGGMGVVHLAVGPNDRAVAIKVLKAHVSDDPGLRLRLAREVEALRRVRHPRVAEVLDADVNAVLPYVVTRFVPGRTLDHLVRERGPMPLARVVHTGRLLAEALRSIHAAGVVHRDVKPANVMLSDDDVVLIDFGIAHVTDDARLTEIGLVMGTPGYLSPEVVAGHPVTPATDWWGWGSTLAFAATGRPPFGTGPIEAILHRVSSGDADLVGLDPRLRSVVATALAAEPGTRPPADWLVGALEDVLTSLASQPSSAAAVAVPPPIGRRPGLQMPTVARPGRNDSAAGEPTVAMLPPGPGPGRAAYQPMPTLVDSPAMQPKAPPVAQAAGPAAAPEPSQGRPGAIPLPGQPTALLLAGVAALAATSAVAPGGAVILLWLWMVVARTADRSALAVRRRRYSNGPRSGDFMLGLALVPIRLPVAAMVSLFAMLVPLAIGVSVAFLAGTGLGGGTGLRTPAEPVALGLAGAASALTAWWGPGAGSVRRGTTWLGRLAVGRQLLHLGLLVFLGFVVVAVLLMLSNGARPDFAPFQYPPLIG